MLLQECSWAIKNDEVLAIGVTISFIGRFKVEDGTSGCYDYVTIGTDAGKLRWHNVITF